MLDQRRGTALARCRGGYWVTCVVGFVSRALALGDQSSRTASLQGQKRFRVICCRMRSDEGFLSHRYGIVPGQLGGRSPAVVSRGIVAGNRHQACARKTQYCHASLQGINATQECSLRIEVPVVCPHWGKLLGVTCTVAGNTSTDSVTCGGKPQHRCSQKVLQR